MVHRLRLELRRFGVRVRCAATRAPGANQRIACPLLLMAETERLELSRRQASTPPFQGGPLTNSGMSPMNLSGKQQSVTRLEACLPALFAVTQSFKTFLCQLGPVCTAVTPTHRKARLTSSRIANRDLEESVGFEPTRGLSKAPLRVSSAPRSATPPTLHVCRTRSHRAQQPH